MSNNQLTMNGVLVPWGSSISDKIFPKETLHCILSILTQSELINWHDRLQLLQLPSKTPQGFPGLYGHSTSVEHRSFAFLFPQQWLMKMFEDRERERGYKESKNSVIKQTQATLLFRMPVEGRCTLPLAALPHCPEFPLFLCLPLLIISS